MNDNVMIERLLLWLAPVAGAVLALGSAGGTAYLYRAWYLPFLIVATTTYCLALIGALLTGRSPQGPVKRGKLSTHAEAGGRDER